MAQSKNPFAQVVPVAPGQEGGPAEVDPFAVLRVASSGPTSVTPAKEISDAVSDSIGGKSADGVEPDETVGGRAKFKKGAFKGMDKTVFYAMLADTVAALGGSERKGTFTRMAMEQKAVQDQLAQRKKELEDDRVFRKAQADADRAARASEVTTGVDQKALDRAHETRLKQMTIDAQSKQIERNIELETEMNQAKEKYGALAKHVGEVFADISLMPDLKLPPEITVEAAMNDPEILERARRIIAPHKERLIFARIEAQGGSKERVRQNELAALSSHGMDLWMQGLDSVSQAEQEATGNFSRTKQILVPDPKGKGGLIQRGTAKDMAMQDTEALGEAVLANPQVRAMKRQEFVDESWMSYLQQNGQAHRMLDGEIQNRIESDFKGRMALLWEREAIATLNDFKARASGVPYLQPQVETIGASDQRTAEANLSATGGTSR